MASGGACCRRSPRQEQWTCARIWGSLRGAVLHLGIGIGGGEIDGRWGGHCVRDGGGRGETRIMSSTRRDAFQAEIKRWTATWPRVHLAATVTIRGHSPESYTYINFRRWSLHSFTMSVLVHLVYIHGFQGKPTSLSKRSRMGLQTISLSRE